MVNHLLREVLPALGLDDGYAAAHLRRSPAATPASALPVEHARLRLGRRGRPGRAGAGRGERRRGRPAAGVGGLPQRPGADGRRADARDSFAPLLGFFRTARRAGSAPTATTRTTGRGCCAPSGCPRRPARGAGRSRCCAGGPGRRGRASPPTAGSPCGCGPAGRVVGAASRQAAVASHPLLCMCERRPGAARRPAEAPPRVLDLTRVLAGPGRHADPRLPGLRRAAGRRAPACPRSSASTSTPARASARPCSTCSDAAARHRLHGLLAAADVLVTGYRPGALAAFGLDPRSGSPSSYPTWSTRP